MREILIRRRAYPAKINYMLAMLAISIVVMAVIFAWIWLSGPNIDTLLTYHRNLFAHNFLTMFDTLTHQDQAPFPQILDYGLSSLGFSRLIALQTANAILIVVVMLQALNLDLKSDLGYLKKTTFWRQIS